MRVLFRLSAVGAALCCAVLAGSPAVASDTASDTAPASAPASVSASGPASGIQMCSEHIRPGLLGGLLPEMGSQTKSCMSSNSAVE
ncbi:hypothetical protein V1L54_12505 [Streptomyces sp. TRM 70361]|uniref:hypothetical protein n=1 Tax=Streptomyces sp. TRM 70361 TaxID=3116553 RepID=UPI002E7B781A|nr:hypothetical protein [Streptomyces sp. TRM 70361]MEE1940212.1 hypothetical protein [Streptomyces sp. TRM 70361]